MQHLGTEEVNSAGKIVLTNLAATSLLIYPANGAVGGLPAVVTLNGDSGTKYRLDCVRELSPEGIEIDSAIVDVSEGRGVPGDRWHVYVSRNSDRPGEPRARQDSRGNTVTVPAGAIMLFDIDSNTEAGRAAWESLALQLKARYEQTFNDQEELSLYVMGPNTFKLILDPPAPPNAFYDNPTFGQTWDLSRGKSVVFGVQVFPAGGGGMPTGNRACDVGQLSPRIEVTSVVDGPTEDTINMGTNGDFGTLAPGGGAPILYTGLNGRTILGADAAAETDFTKAVVQRETYARFYMRMKMSGMVPENFDAKRRSLRLYAYLVVS